MTRDNGITKLRILPAAERQDVIKKYEAEETKAEAEKRKQDKPM